MNLIDRYHPNIIEKRKEKLCKTLEVFKWVLRAEAVALSAVAIKDPSFFTLCLLPFAYLNHEWAMIAGNAQQALKKNSTVISMIADHTLYENQMFHYAPVHKFVYQKLHQ